MSTEGWRGAQLFERADWEFELRASERAQLEQQDASAPVAALPRLAALAESLEHGTGATRLRGLLPEDADAELAARSFWSLARQLGTPVSQSARGERLLHVRDEGYAPDDARYRGPFSKRDLSFHSDRCDLIAFLCLRPAKHGGESELVSSRALKQELERRDPAALRALEQPLPWLRHSVDSGNARRWCMLPVFSEHEGHFAAGLMRVLIERADRDPEAPSPTDEQRAALDLLESIASEPDMHARFRLERGDVLLVNNWEHLHRRAAFEDHEQPHLRRHLLRLWLSTPNSRPLAPAYAAHFGATGAGQLRGGMHPG